MFLTWENHGRILGMVADPSEYKRLLKQAAKEIRMATKFKAEDVVVVSDTEHPNYGVKGKVEKVNPKSEDEPQSYAIISEDGRHAFNANEDQLTSNEKK